MRYLIGAPKTKKKEIPEKLKVLAEEARKYKSVEEWKSAIAKEPRGKTLLGEAVLGPLSMKGKLVIDYGFRSLADFYNQATMEHPIEAPKAKEPWRMTKREFGEAGLDKVHLLRRKGRFPKDVEGYLDSLTAGDPKWVYTMFGGEGLGRFRSHKYIIEQAISEGKPIPDAVRADYPSLFKPELAPKAEFLYHGTTTSRGQQIAEKGLLPGLKAETTAGENIFLSATPEYAKTYATRKDFRGGIVLRVKATPDIIADVNTGLTGDYKTLKDIPPENIEIQTSTGWQSIREFYKLAAKPELAPEASKKKYLI